MNSLGFNAIYPILMSLTIFAGSMEFVAANLLLGVFHPMNALFLTLMVNARHLFYGISMLDKYKGIGKKKWFFDYYEIESRSTNGCDASITKDRFFHIQVTKRVSRINDKFKVPLTIKEKTPILLRLFFYVGCNFTYQFFSCTSI